MKLRRVLLLILITFFGVSVSALRTTRFEPLFEMDEEFSGDQIAQYFGWRGEDAYQIEMNLEFDSSAIELLQVVPGETFKIEYTSEKVSANRVKYHLKFTSDTIFPENIYTGIVFNVKDLAIKKDTELKITDIYAYGDNNSKFRSKGYYIEMKREANNRMSYVRTDINENTDRSRLFDKLLPFIIIGIIAAFLIIFAILLIPSRKTEDRRHKIDSQLDPTNYPIPGVGPLPKMKKKSKKEIIEPEEKVIQPLKDYLSKSTDVNQELINKGLEVDKNMFKDNPKKEGEDGLININPLAFDDGEEEILDDGTNHNKNDDDDIDVL